MSQIKHPNHYTWHPSGIECKSINQHLLGNLSAAFKYVYRHQHKGKPQQDIQKAIQHLEFETNLIKAKLVKDGHSGNKSPRLRPLTDPEFKPAVLERLAKMLRHGGSDYEQGFYENLLCAIVSVDPVAQFRRLEKSKACLETALPLGEAA